MLDSIIDLYFTLFQCAKTYFPRYYKFESLTYPVTSVKSPVLKIITAGIFYKETVTTSHRDGNFNSYFPLLTSNSLKFSEFNEPW